MMKKISRMTAIYLCAVFLLLPVGCSRRASEAEIAALREQYPYTEYNDTAAYIITYAVPSFDYFWTEEGTIVAVVELTDDYYAEPFTASPVGEETDEIKVGTWNIVYLPVRVKKVLAGRNSVVTEDAEMYIHLGSIEFCSEEMLKSYHKGAKFLVMANPTIGKLPQGSAGENIYTGDCIAYVTEDDLLLSIYEREGDIMEKYSGYPVSSIEKDIQKSYQTYQAKHQTK